jgi:hypothetical protein
MFAGWEIFQLLWTIEDFNFFVSLSEILFCAIAGSILIESPVSGCVQLVSFASSFNCLGSEIVQSCTDSLLLILLCLSF